MTTISRVKCLVVEKLMAGDLTVPSPPQRSKHRSFTVEFKIGVVEWVEHHSSSVRAASVHFGLDRKVIRSWIRKKQVLRYTECLI